MRIFIIVAASFTLSACVADMTKGLQPMVGKPASVAFAKIGMPTDERLIAGQKVYIWATSRLVGSRGEISDYNCTVRIFVDSIETITSYDWSGNLGGCANLMQRLDVL